MLHRLKTMASAVVLTALAFGAGAGHAQSPDTIVATVEGTDVTLGDLQAIHQSLPEQLRSAPFEALFPQLRERAVDSVLLLKGAEKAQLAGSPEVQTRLDDAKKRIMQQVFLEKSVAAVVTDEEIQARYDEVIGSQEQPSEVRARHILVETEQDALGIIAQLEGGADFAALAREKSTGPSGRQGGDLGYFQREQMVPEFAEAAFTQTVGTYTKSPVKTQFGWHVIYVEDRRQQPAPGLDEVEDTIREALSREAVDVVIQELRDGTAVELFSIDGAPEAAQ